MGNAGIQVPFECPICGSDGFTQIQIRQRDGRWTMTDAYECKGCSTMFRVRDQFSKHRRVVMGADGKDIKADIEKRWRR